MTRKYTDPMDSILDRPIAYNPAFRRISGSTTAGIFLSQCWYWSKRHRDDDGWFYETQKQWEEETGLSRYEQKSARNKLLAHGFIEEKLKGVPATMHYRVCKKKIYEALGVQFVATPQSEAIRKLDCSDSANKSVASLANFNESRNTSSNSSMSSNELIGDIPKCPDCKVEMVRRKNGDAEFWGCPNFKPKGCRQTMNYPYFIPGSDADRKRLNESWKQVAEH